VRKFIFILFQIIISVNLFGQPLAQNGVLDLSSTKINEKGTINLNGYWDFYWKEFISPYDFLEQSAPQNTAYIEIPSLWTQTVLDGKKLPSLGYASYHLKILLPSSSIVYGLKIPRIETSAKIWVDDKLVSQIGQPDTNAELTVPSWQMPIVFFKPKSKTTHITIQVANFSHKKAGITHSIELGSQKEILKKYSYSFGFDVFMLGLVLIMALHHLGLYFLRKDDKGTLYFALLCIAISLFIITHGQMLINSIIPNLPFEISVKLNWFGIIGSPLFLMYFVHINFPGSIKEIFVKIIKWVYIAYFIFILIFPVKIFTTTLFFFFGFSFFSMLIIVIGIIKATREKKIGSKISLVASIFIFLTFVNDTLYDGAIINTFYAIPLGMFIFTLMQSFMLSLKNSSNEVKIKKLNNDFSILDKIKSRLISEQNYSLNPLNQIISEELGLARCFLIVNEDQVYTVLGAYDIDNKYLVERMPMSLSDKQLKYNLPVELIERYMELKHSKIFTDIENITFSKAYFNKFKPRSIICKVISQGQGFDLLIYAEATINNKKQLNEKSVLIDFIESQIFTLVENYYILSEIEELNRTLEEKVEQRTAEVFQQKEEITAQRDEIEEKNQRLQQALLEREHINRTLQDSINYAKRIQESILPKENEFKEVFPEAFIFFLPKTTLSGDFSWFQQKGDLFYLAAVDCTGHGVPGALMAIIGNNLLEQAVNEFKLESPAKILDAMEKGLHSRLHNNKRDEVTKDGMDISLIVYNRSTRELRFSGAHNPGYYFSPNSNDLRILTPNPLSIGGLRVRKESKKFVEKKLIAEKDAVLYLFSDGFYDQIGGIKGRKFMKSSFKELLINIHTMDMNNQKKKLIQTYEDWKSNLSQIDDILVIGIKF